MHIQSRVAPSGKQTISTDNMHCRRIQLHQQQPAAAPLRHAAASRMAVNRAPPPAQSTSMQQRSRSRRCCCVAASAAAASHQQQPGSGGLDGQPSEASLGADCSLLPLPDTPSPATASLAVAAAACNDGDLPAKADARVTVYSSAPFVTSFLEQPLRQAGFSNLHFVGVRHQA